jgi:hypothetical protein
VKVDVDVVGRINKERVGNVAKSREPRLRSAALQLALIVVLHIAPADYTTAATRYLPLSAPTYPT